MVLSLPLLATGTCVNSTTESIIDGFFNAATSLMVSQLREDLGLRPTGTGTSTGTTTSTAAT